MRGRPGVWPGWPHESGEVSQASTTPAPSSGPTNADLCAMADAGWTHEEVHEAWERTTGADLTCATVHIGLVRARCDPAPRVGVLPLGAVAGPAEPSGRACPRMLRAWGHREIGVPLDPRTAHRVDGFIAMLAREQAVIGYDPVAPAGQGFLLLPESWRASAAGLPLRVRPIDGWVADDVRACSSAAPHLAAARARRRPGRRPGSARTLGSTDRTGPMSSDSNAAPAAQEQDPMALMRSRAYVKASSFSPR